MAKKPVIKVQNLVKKYKDFTAVNGISFEVYEGEIFGLLGPNGAGKTTTLEIIETLRDETDGNVEVLGHSINKNPAKVKEQIGIQLQSSGFYPNLTLVQLIKLFQSLYGTDGDPIELLKKVNLVDKQKALVNKLSGGQRQRFAIATTLINHPKIIFLDEPTTGLDPQARRNLWELIREIRKAGTTVVITTHYMDEAEFLCDRIGIMDEGKIIAIDTPENLIKNLLKNGFKREKVVQEANLEDVFLSLTGKQYRD
ncbi:MAG: ABC transporter ATP-binding protein [Candidatus Dojkabacteria bacterium]